MGLLDKLLTAGGVAAVGVLAGSAFKNAQETSRRRNSPLCFDDGVTQSEFIEIAREIARRTPRVHDVSVTRMTATLSVRSSSGLTDWTADVDFNDYGHLTGTYWLESENTDSLIPKHFGDAVQREIETRVSRTEIPQEQPRPLHKSADGTHYWDGQQYIPMPAGFTWDGYRWAPSSTRR